MRFKDKSVLITGAAGVLGSDLARAITREGAARLYLLDRDVDALTAVCDSIGPHAKMICCDISDPVSVREAWASLDLEVGLDALFTAAGILAEGPTLENIPLDDWDKLFAINVRGTLLAIQLSLPLLRKKTGSIVTYGSTAGLTGSRLLGAYSASKGAIEMLTRSFALNLADEGIRVNSVCPGSINSSMLEKTVNSASIDTALTRQTYLSAHPMGRFGEVGEVTAAAMFLASSDAGFITGVSLPVDGGRLA